MHFLLIHISENYRNFCIQCQKISGATKTRTSSLQHLPEAERSFLYIGPKNSFVFMSIYWQKLCYSNNIFITTHIFFILYTFQVVTNSELDSSFPLSLLFHLYLQPPTSHIPFMVVHDKYFGFECVMFHKVKKKN